jgi:hypothetical protein
MYNEERSSVGMPSGRSSGPWRCATLERGRQIKIAHHKGTKDTKKIRLMRPTV